MTDILERLRDERASAIFDSMVALEAADEIARLRDENKHVGGLWVAETRENERLRAENERLVAALLPFVHYAELNDLRELERDDAIEVPVRDLIAAEQAYNALTNGDR